ncbi:MAG: MBL fold metallo-hydrolase [Bacteriovoracaceae bacterium]|nr:MBL fold metallo-hydrolase [Bacteriovoracaceae bacterium]
MSFSKTVLTITTTLLLIGAALASENGISVDKTKYKNRKVLADFTSAPCPETPRGLVQIKDNLYRHTTGAGLAVHSGLVLITSEGSLVIDPAMTCTTGWLRDEIKNKFKVSIKYVVYTHAHADHISGAQILQKAGAIVVANQRAL